MTQTTKEETQAAINTLRANTMRDRLLILQHEAIELAASLGAIRKCPDQVEGTSRREMQLRCAESDIASAKKFVEFFLTDIAKTP